ncbi:fructose-2,6-bisphosphatase [Stutzerimonas urumqiensis]|uniref:fructose-2,6-bisphosphatase n=1 Tax=Stutzerimonas urumqiensis TaxID=638269 RepID=UPI003DA2BAF9
MQIILVRHGRPDHRNPRWCTPREMKTWIARYNAARVVVGEAPPAVRALASQAGWVVCSSLSRCMQSRSQLVQGPQHAGDALFAEAHLPYLDWDFPRLPARFWRLVFRGAWFLGFSRHTESVRVSDRRARVAAEQLIALAETHGRVLLMGHGIMNILIGRHLRRLGWSGPLHLFLRPYWSPSVYEKGA